MNILDRVRVALLRRELATLRAADRVERDQAQTTDDMMRHVVKRAARIVELQNRVRAIEGEDEFDIEDDTQIPSDMGIPTEALKKTH